MGWQVAVEAMTLIWWLRRDPRLDDNTALQAAFDQSGGAVLPVFILDDAILRAPNTAPARVHFLMESLRELDEQLRQRGSRLVVRRGTPATELVKLLDESGAEGIYFNRDYEPYALERDAAVRMAVEAHGRRVASFADHLLAEPDLLLTSEDKPPTVYTPYRRRWLARLEADPSLTAKRSDAARLHFVPLAGVEGLAVPTAAELGFVVTQTVMPPGALAGNELLKTFVRRAGNGLRAYHHERNLLAVDGTSRLSIHFRLGTLAARSAVRVALALREHTDDPDERKAIETWLGELAWRDFYTGIMVHFPSVLERPFRDLFLHFPYREAPADLQAWQEGRTGYPLVDAGMRQLRTEAFMHNRARLVTASFLCKHLLIDYRAGEQFFMQQLGCGELAVNNGNWQWVAGSSNDPQPYFHIFNPVTQSATYDPDGEYIRRYVPELATVPTEYIHAPWTMLQPVAASSGVQLGRDYPTPIIDHKAARARALAAFESARTTSFS